MLLPEYQERVILEYIAKHAGHYIYLALESLGFYPEFYRLGNGSDLTAVMANINTHYLHVKLRRVDDPGRGLHNRVCFESFTTRDVNLLQAGEGYLGRLVVHCPAVLLGFTISLPGVDDPTPTTVIYPFNSSTMRTVALGTARIVDSIIDAEGVLQGQGRD